MFLEFIHFESLRESEWGRERKWERERTVSRLHAVSTEPDLGLGLLNGEMDLTRLRLSVLCSAD